MVISVKTPLGINRGCNCMKYVPTVTPIAVLNSFMSPDISLNAFCWQKGAISLTVIYQKCTSNPASSSVLALPAFDSVNIT